MIGEWFRLSLRKGEGRVRVSGAMVSSSAWATPHGIPSPQSSPLAERERRVACYISPNSKRRLEHRSKVLHAAARRAELPKIVIRNQVVARLDLRPGRIVRRHTAAHWVGAKPVVYGSYCACYTTRVGISAGNVKLRCD